MIPSKLQAGQNFKTATVNKVNEIIDYLKTQRITSDNKTIKVNQFTSGIGLSVINNSVKGGSCKSSPFNHPFKMTIIEDEDGNQKLNIQEGRFTISNTFTDRTWVAYFEQNALDLSEISSVGEYYVMLLLKYNPTGNVDKFDNTYFQCNVYFVNSTATTNLVPGTRGIQSIPIGLIEVTSNEDKLTFTITRQDLVSDLFLEFNSLKHPFSITATSDAFTDGSLKNSYSLSEFEFHVQEGNAIVDEEMIKIPAETLHISKNSYIYCTIQMEDGMKTGGIQSSNSLLDFHNKEEKTFNYLLGTVSFDSTDFGITIQQFIHSTINVVNGSMEVSGSLSDWEEITYASGQCYLRWKPEFNDEASITYDDKFYFMGSVKNGNHSVLSGLSFGKDKSSDGEKDAVMLWSRKTGVPYITAPPAKTDENSSYCLVGESAAGVKWEPYSTGMISLSGSIQNVFEIISVEGSTDEKTEKRVLRVKPEYDKSVDQFYFLNLEPDGTLSSRTFFGEPATEGLQSIFVWNYEQKEPYALICKEERPDEDYVLGGSKETGLYWIGLYDTISSEIMALSSEFYKVKVSESDPSGNFLSEKLYSELSSLTFSIEQGNEESLAVDINAKYFHSSDGTISIAETPEGLDFNISSYLVQVQEGDEPEYLSEKITSTNGSLSADIGSTGIGASVDLSINPAYFYSSDGTISIAETDKGLDFNISSYLVQVQEGDEPEFLSEKIISVNDSLTVGIDSSGVGAAVNVEINPGYFTSSDGSLTIETSENGLDFNGAGKVQINGGDTADFLVNKLVVDASISDLITLEDTGSTLNIKSALNGSGLLKIENGKISSLTPPSGGNYLLACSNGQFTWVEYANCEDACATQE